MLKFIAAIGIAFASVVGLILAVVAWIFLSTPRPTDIKSCLTTKLFAVHLCPKDGDYTKVGDISAAAKNAVLVSEDSAFYDHHGIDWFELRQSAEKDWEKGHFARGGSTITQQLAKNVYLTNDKSILRKLREAIIATQIENTLTKNEILEKYLNVVEFGPNLFGIGKAARFYFDKSPAKLNAAEGAFLAFLLPNPKSYSVSFRKKHLSKFAHSQMRIIVDRLFRFKKITEQSHEAAVYQVNHFFGTNDFDNGEYDPSAVPSGEESTDDEGTDAGPAVPHAHSREKPRDDSESASDDGNPASDADLIEKSLESATHSPVDDMVKVPDLEPENDSGK